MKKTVSVILVFLLLFLTFPIFNANAKGEELMKNKGFEDADISMWTANGCKLERDSANKNSGSFSIKVTERTQAWSSAQQDITQILLTNGQGNYNFSTYMKLVDGEVTTNMFIVVSIESDKQGKQWYSGNAAGISSTSFTKSTASNAITWQGTLTRAIIYVQNSDANAKPSLYIDDFSLVQASAITPGPDYIPTAQTLEKRSSGAPAVGAIRWDAWLPQSQGTFGSNSSYNVGAQVARSLGPNKYHFRLPYFSIVNGENDVDFPPITQTQMDEEINYAAYAGIDYWAYCWYPIGSGMDTARNMHVSSSIRDKVKMSAIIFTDSFDDASRAQLVGYFKENFYMKVQGGRPLIFFFSNDNVLNTIGAIQQDCIKEGIPLPYCVSMAGASLGIDAVSRYAESGTNGESYNSLTQRVEKNWDTQKAVGNNELPFVSCGWDPRPRYDHPVAWGTVSADSWVQTATAGEIAAHLQNAINWTKSNTSSTLANAVLMYAWNEHDEGGWLCPTVQVDANGIVQKSGNKNLINTDRIDALHNLLRASSTTSAPSNLPNSTESISTESPAPENTLTTETSATDELTTQNPESIPPKSKVWLPILGAIVIVLLACGGFAFIKLHKKAGAKDE